MKPCSACHETKDLADFYGAGKYRSGKPRISSVCKVCHNLKVREWQAENKDKVRAYVRKSCKKAYYANVEKYRAKSKIQRIKNPELRKKIWNNWYVANKKYAIKMAASRQRRVKQATPNWLTAIQKSQISELYEIANAIKMQTGIPHHVDHIVPLNGKDVKGLHVPWNLRVIPAMDNLSKRNKFNGG